MRFTFDIPKLLDWVVSTWSPVHSMAEHTAYSRSHFSRMFTACVGESARSLRRRLRIEAGAYLLRTTNFQVGEVAVEVGYETPEAFSKAFRSAHGCTPNDFRRSTNPRFRLPSASGIHFHPSGLIVRRQGDTKMRLSEIMIRHHVDEVGAILEAMERLPESAIDSEIIDCRDGIPWDAYAPTLRGVVAAIVSTESIWLSALEGEPFPEIEANPSVDHLRTVHESSGPRLVELVRDIESNNLWDSEFVDALCHEPTRFSFGSVIAHVLTFAAHRRQLALSVLRRLGVTDMDYGDPINWVRKQNGGTANNPVCEP